MTRTTPTAMPIRMAPAVAPRPTPLEQIRAILDTPPPGHGGEGAYNHVNWMVLRIRAIVDAM